MSLQSSRLIPAGDRAGDMLTSAIAAALAYFSILYLYSNLSFRLMTMGSTGFRPSYFYVIVLAVALAMAIVSPAAGTALATHRRIVFVLLAYPFLLALRTMFAPITDDAVQLLISRTEFVLMTISFIVLFSICKNANRLVQCLAVSVLLIIGANLAEFYFPEYFESYSSTPGRAAGLYMNANDSASHIGLALPLLAYFAWRPMRYVWYVLALAGIAVTFSRGGLILWFAAILLTEVVKQRVEAGVSYQRLFSSTLAIVVVIAVLALIVSMAIDVETLFPNLDRDTRARIEGEAGDSDRIYLAREAFRQFLDAPLFGNGVGEYSPPPLDPNKTLGSHNAFVQMLAELGVVGGVWIAAFLMAIGAYGLPFGVPLVVMYSIAAFFSHNHFDYPELGLLWALYLVAARPLAAPPPTGEQERAAT